MVTTATQPEHNRISSSPVQKHESNPTLNCNEACCLAIITTLPNVDSHISMLLLFILVPGQGTGVCPSRAWIWSMGKQRQGSEQRSKGQRPRR
jgi:hypothetical protein